VTTTASSSWTNCIMLFRSDARRGPRTLQAGVDFDLPDGEAFAKLPEALAAGLVTQAEIDNAVRRMLRLEDHGGSVRKIRTRMPTMPRRSRGMPRPRAGRGSGQQDHGAVGRMTACCRCAPR